MTSEWDQPASHGGLVPARNPAHEDPNWYQLDLDDQIEDPDAEPRILFPTERHRVVPS